MSGGVGPIDDIILKEKSKPEQHQPPSHQTHLRGRLFSFHQLNALAVAVILSASGMVAAEDFAFVIFSFFYFYFMSKVAYPTLSPSHDHPVLRNHRLLRLHSFLGVLVGLFLPVAYILEGVLEGDKEGIKAATPHVFLLASQVFIEGVAVWDRFSSVMRTLVMVVYNSTRMFSLMEWVRSEMLKEFDGIISSRRLFVGRVLAVANLGYWGLNLFGFLLPFYLPRAFERYYSDIGKNVED
ncbi:hypothetical protein SSX86_010781 [Deinandra increscens subsp. villosa]|uniref:DUF7733 domain-containing protein n=1 Tax=Deinandra increscens subsp. villosa TaxID=3103831 RepID=A0AAP0H2N8_9ASTR